MIFNLLTKTGSTKIRHR